MVWLIAQFPPLGLGLPASLVGATYDPRRMLLAALELILATLDFVGAGERNSNELHFIQWVVCLSARRVTFDPVLAVEFGGMATVPSDRLRPGIRITAVASMIGMPRGTAYRHMRNAEAAGMLERHGAGARATHAFLDSFEFRSTTRLVTVRVIRALQRATAAGFRFEDPGAHYRCGRPRLPGLEDRGASSSAITTARPAKSWNPGEQVKETIH
jgi:hypothetical protein